MGLMLVDATYQLLDAAIADPARLGLLLKAEVADGWEGFPEALPGLRSAYRGKAGPYAWGTLLLLIDDPRTLVGLGGYKGMPSSEGVVEIGYAIAPALRGRGWATEAVKQMVRRAFADPTVTAIDAQTLGESSPSTGVLEKVGLRQVGETVDPEVGPIWQWRLQRPAFG